MDDACILVSDCDSVSMELFLPELQLAFDSMPDEVLASYVRDAAIQFCDRTSIVQQVLSLDFQCGVKDLLLIPLCGMRVVAIQKYSTYLNCDHFESPNTLRYLNVCGASSARFVPPRVLRLSTAPSQDRQDAMRVRVSVAPDRDACEIPSELYQRYHRAIIAGVKAEIYTLDKWANPALAARNDKIFEAACTVANIDRMLNYHRGPTQMRSRSRIV